MAKNYNVSIQENEGAENEIAVLRVASASKNSQSQFYPSPVRVSGLAIGELHKKMLEKLKLHKIDAVTLNLTLKLANDKSINFTDAASLASFDTQVSSLTSLVSLKWNFLFNSDEQDHLHSVYVRISERPNPAMLLQKAMSLSSEELESFDREALASISCRVDFFDGRFSNELLAVVSEWVASLPKAEPTFGLVKWLDEHEEDIGRFVVGVSPCVCLAALAAIWVTYVPDQIAGSLRYGIAWLLLSGIAFYFSRYIAILLMKFFAKNISRMNSVPVFDITAGDRQKLTKFLAKSHRASIYAGGSALTYGFLKGIGLWLASSLIPWIVKL